MLEYISKAERDKVDDADFAGPHRSFPIRNQTDVHNAARLIGHADDPDAVKAAIIRIAKRKGLSLPDAWQTKEAAMPKNRIARIKTYFLEDDAVSLNNRKYPKEAVDRLIASAQAQIADPNGLPMTSYLSHGDADRDATRYLVGKVTHVAREGTKVYGMIDIPDTVAGRDVVALIKGGYIKSQSLRASGAEMRMDGGMPLVAGQNLKLEGIDFTSNPGLPQVARIADVTESAGPQMLSEVFIVSAAHSLEEDDDMKEELISPLATGDSPSMTSEDPADAYQKRMYKMPGNADPNIFPVNMQEVHDHVATVVGHLCAPSGMEASLKKVLQERGASLSSANRSHLVKAHDGVAQHLGLECATSDGMNDGDDDDGQSKKEKKDMTPEDALKVLESAGYKVEPPKTQEQILQEKLDAMQAAFTAQLTAMQEALQPKVRHATRQSLVEATSVQASKKPYYRNGDYLREQLRDEETRAQLLDRSRPMPEWLTPERALAELQIEYLGMYDARFGLEG